MIAPHKSTRTGRLFAGAICATLLGAHALLAWTAVTTKSPTASEPMHALSAYLRRFHADFRLDPSSPQLTSYLAMLPHRASSLRVDLESIPRELLTADTDAAGLWTVRALYHTSGNDPDAFINRSRAMMLVLSVMLGAVICAWAWMLAGPVAAMIATALYSLDPNFLGHAPLVNGDVSIALLAVSMMLSLWLCGQRMTLARASVSALLLGAGVNTTFSGLLLIPMFVATLGLRALLPRPWIVPGGRIAVTRGRRLFVVGATCAAAAVVLYISIWASYGFRFAPTSDASLRMNMQSLAAAGARSPICGAILFCDRHELLPQAYLAGLLDAHARWSVRPAYLMRAYSRTGWWYYFPLAMLFKTPLATIAAVGLALLLAIYLRLQKLSLDADWWMLTCLFVPVVVYATAALTGILNFELRYILALYPFLFILIAAVIAQVGRLLPRATLVLALILCAGLAAETLRAHPNYIAFFNTAAGGARGGFRLLGDSNLDWGQDLKLLRRWQQKNPDVKLYVAYSGTADPEHYVRCTPMPGTQSARREPRMPDDPGVIAVSAGVLQGDELGAALRAYYQDLWMWQEPIDVLGGTIYLYPFPSGARQTLPLQK